MPLRFFERDSIVKVEEKKNRTYIFSTVWPSSFRHPMGCEEWESGDDRILVRKYINPRKFTRPWNWTMRAIRTAEAKMAEKKGKSPERVVRKFILGEKRSVLLMAQYGITRMKVEWVLHILSYSGACCKWMQIIFRSFVEYPIYCTSHHIFGNHHHNSI